MSRKYKMQPTLEEQERAMNRGNPYAYRVLKEGTYDVDTRYKVDDMKRNPLYQLFYNEGLRGKYPTVDEMVSRGKIPNHILQFDDETIGFDHERYYKNYGNLIPEREQFEEDNRKKLHRPLYEKFKDIKKQDYKTYLKNFEKELRVKDPFMAAYHFDDLSPDEMRKLMPIQERRELENFEEAVNERLKKVDSLSGLKAAGKVGSRFIPVVGQILQAMDIYDFIMNPMEVDAPTLDTPRPKPKPNPMFMQEPKGFEDDLFYQGYINAINKNKRGM